MVIVKNIVMEPMDFYRGPRPPSLGSPFWGSSDSGGKVMIIVQNLVMEPMAPAHRPALFLTIGQCKISKWAPNSVTISSLC